MIFAANKQRMGMLMSAYEDYLTDNGYCFETIRGRQREKVECRAAFCAMVRSKYRLKDIGQTVGMHHTSVHHVVANADVYCSSVDYIKYSASAETHTQHIPMPGKTEEAAQFNAMLSYSKTLGRALETNLKLLNAMARTANVGEITLEKVLNGEYDNLF